MDAAITLAPFALPGTIKDWKLVKKHLPYLAGTALLGGTASNTLIYIASHTTQAINMALIATASPIFMVIMSRIFYGERITWKKAAGIAKSSRSQGLTPLYLVAGVGLLLSFLQP